MIGKAAFVLALALAARPALALESAPVTSSRVVATLISDTDTVQPGQPFKIALRLRIKPGWHTYWSNPGDAGVAPALDLALPEGAKAGPIEWPTPSRMPEGPVMAYGYTGDVVLPMTVTPGQGALEIKATATWLVCEKICVPEDGTFSLALPSGPAAQSVEWPLFQAAAARTPRPSPFMAQIAPDGMLTLSGAGLSPDAVREAWFFPSEPDRIDHDAPQTLQTDQGAVHLALKPAQGFHSDTPLSGVVVVTDRGGQVTSLAVTANPGAPLRSGGGVTAWQAIALALLGGLLLNLMPCVFPILAMKAVGLARHAGEGKAAVRSQALAYTAGVLVTFAGLAGVLVVARQAGAQVGWGFQFQSPIFVAVTAWLLFAVGLNLSGVFGVGGRLAGVGQGLAARQGWAGSFFTGLLAVLVATPCTAPFMGAAIAVALAAAPAVTILIFLSMGLGLALPYVALSLVPGLARLLPRPGAWMDVMRNVLAFPMYGAAVWLLWVMSLQAGPDGVLRVGVGFVLVGFAAWATGLVQSGRRPWAYVVPAMALVLAAALLPSMGSAVPAVASTAAEADAFTPARLAQLRAEGRPVFVNMTAAWCVTCLVNERVTLSAEPVQQAFRDHHVAYLKGDWTRADPAITAFLQGFARDGVPLYVFYPAGMAEPVVLPQILTQSDLLSHLDQIRS